MVDRTWHSTSDYRTQWRETDDPRLLEIITLDEDPNTPDGDVFAPAYWVDTYGYSWQATRAGSTFEDETVADALMLAWNTWGKHSDTADRYLRIFHGSSAILLDSHVVQGGSELLLLDTPAHREHVGRDAGKPLAHWSTPEFLRGDVDTWQAYLDQEVYAIGYATMTERTTTETPIDPDLTGWSVEPEVWGYYGEEWAREAISSGELAEPDLQPMLPAV
jgi:hypothetical protein